MLRKLSMTLATLRAERRARWSEDERTCAMCGKGYAEDDSCACQDDVVVLDGPAALGQETSSRSAS